MNMGHDAFFTVRFREETEYAEEKNFFTGPSKNFTFKV